MAISPPEADWGIIPRLYLLAAMTERRRNRRCFFMLRRRFLWSILVVVLAATLLTGMPGCRSGSKGGYVAIEDDFPPYLKDLAEELDFYVGAAVGYGGNMYPNNQQYVEVLQREFNAVVAENVMKWQTIRWSESSYNFTPG